MLGIQSADLLLSTTDSNRASTGRRKSIPNRSINKGDAVPGIVFRVEGGVRVLDSKGNVCDWDSSALISAGGTDSWRCWSKTGMQASMSVPRFAATATNTIIDEDDAWGWSLMRKSHDTPNANGLASGGIENNISGGLARIRARSYSFSQPERATAGNTFIDVERRDPGGLSDSEGDASLRGGASSGGEQSSNITRRRASIAGTSSTPSGPAPITVYSGSLAHLVPNSFLATTSRRISTHGAAPGCVCSSCNCLETPYWRDGWSENVMLCNACGLRFQKFARRCPACKYIPRKEDSLGSRCIKCATPWVVGPPAC